MPTISMFYGMIIRMYFAPGEHSPPHFHVYYNEYKAFVDIRTCEIMEGDLPNRQRKIVLAWAELHQEELMADWRLVMTAKTRSGFNRFSKQESDMYPSVAKAVPNEDFTLTIVFDNGEEGILDMKPYLDFGVFRRIKDYDQFKRVQVAFDAIEWDSGVDLDPEFVYAKCKTATKA